MMSRTCLFIAALAAMGCGSSDSNDSNNSATGQQCGTASPACTSCITQNCNTEAMTTFGGGYTNYQFNGGQCPNLMTCSCTALGRASGGMSLCAEQDGTGCAAAFAALTSCLNANPCGTACTGNNGNGDNVVGAGGDGVVCGSGYYDSGNGECIPTGWTKLGTSGFNDAIWKLATDASGNVYAAGSFTNAGGYRYVAKWNGASWSELGNLNANGAIYSITTDTAGNVYAVGDFYAFDGHGYMAKWDGMAWSEITGYGSYLYLTADAVGNVYNGNSKWNGTAWSTIFTGFMPNGNIETYATNASGSIQYAAGDFSNGLTQEGGYKYVAQWDGATVSALGNLNANNDISALATDASGNLYAGGLFTNGANSWSGSRYLAKWNGSTWSEVGTLNANSGIERIAINPISGNIYVTGETAGADRHCFLAEWNGSTWSEIGHPGQNLASLVIDASGKLYSVVAVMVGDRVVFRVVKRN